MNGTITKQLIYMARKAQLIIGSRLAPYGITAAEEPFFMMITHHSGATQEELTAMVGVDKSATTRAVRSLENKGYLTRKQDTKDHRQNRVFATNQAMEITEQVHAELLRLDNEITKGLSKQDIQILTEAFTLMEKNLADIRGNFDQKT